ncbi:MAG TPA: fumarylacetoacetate hydrolase family protein [Xanthobacteraceae bacterium]|nr:fumarylacetoacetate hydrolase family protein [Xanthobacteraceae bacterium]
MLKIVGFEKNGALRLGVVDGESVIDLQAADPRVPSDLGRWLAENDGDLKPLGDVAKRAPSSARLLLASIRFALPVARPGKIVCLGLNYLEHAKEGGHQKPEYPSIFMRCQTSLTPHLAPIVRPFASETLDYEAELLVVIGRRIKHARLDEALACVAGYSCFNDGSVRKFQRRTSQWDMGKNFDHTGGFGPWVVEAQALPPGAKGLKIESRLSGQVLQSDNTANMMFAVAETIVDVTQGMTLEPGDIIAMGTPSGVGHARKPPLWMRAGDVCEIEIEGIGVLRNPIVEEAVAAGRAAAE